MARCSECDKEMGNNAMLRVSMKDNLERPHELCYECFMGWVGGLQVEKEGEGEEK